MGVRWNIEQVGVFAKGWNKSPIPNLARIYSTLTRSVKIFADPPLTVAAAEVYIT